MTALQTRETRYGSVTVLHEGELTVWRIEKDGEDVDPARSICDREDVLVVTEGTLRLELGDEEPLDVAAGESVVIPPGTPFRGYRWPRDGDRCVFVAIAPSDATFVTAD